MCGKSTVPSGNIGKVAMPPMQPDGASELQPGWVRWPPPSVIRGESCVGLVTRGVSARAVPRSGTSRAYSATVPPTSRSPQPPTDRYARDVLTKGWQQQAKKVVREITLE